MITYLFSNATSAVKVMNKIRIENYDESGGVLHFRLLW